MKLPLADATLILFDIDGTLLLPKGCGRAAMRLTLLELFQTETDLESHVFGGKTDWQSMTELMARHGYDAADIGRMMPAYEEAAARHLGRIIGDFPVQACPGAIDVVLALQDHPRLVPGLLTGNAASIAPIKLRAAGFDPGWFRVGAFGSEAISRNDLPALAVARAEALLGRRIPAEQVIVIGDTPMDVACARAIGAVAAAVLTGFSSREELLAAEPDILLDDLSDFVGSVVDSSVQ